MYKWFISILFLIVANSSNAQTKVVADIIGLKNNKGVCRACIFTSASSFSGKGNPFECIVLPVINKAVQARFESIPPGIYAISVFHDSNNNNKLDKNFLGIPKEGYGASKNNLPFASAPNFEDNQFTVHVNTISRLSIKIRNLGE
jgi:uncharacterized protein (DUF2141 family)